MDLQRAISCTSDNALLCPPFDARVDIPLARRWVCQIGAADLKEWNSPL
jgi:hypothetical protein